MCGIAGKISFTRPVARDQLSLMLREMVHRGPDDEGCYVSPADRLPSAALGHRRLRILDLSPSGHQPMTNETGDIWLVFNGEIYNYLPLRDELLKMGHRFRSSSDTEVIIHLYEEYGEKCLDYLRGMFAFALWDERKMQLFAARDRVGKKPLYYAETSEGFAFASEINSFYPLPDIPKELNEAAIDYFLTYAYIPSPATIFHRIKKLPPAHYLILQEGRLELTKYWQLAYAPKLDISFDEAKQRIDELLDEATRIRLFSDVPLGCFLSGGIDSSAVVAMMSRHVTSPVKTFSIGFAEDDFDERPYARRIAELYGTEHHEFVVKPDALEVLPELVRHFGEPFADSAAIPTWYLSEMTRKHVTVALNGDGGDESFAGYNWYLTGTRLHEVRRLLPAFFWRSLESVVPHAPVRGGFRKALRFLELVAKDDPSRFADLRTVIDERYKQRIYTQEFQQRRGRQSEEYLLRFYDEGLCTQELDRMMFTDVMSYLPEQLLVKVDRMTMAHSLEGRSPFLDHTLMEFAARLPAEYKLKNGSTKHVLKETVKALFPSGFLDRPKMGFNVPLNKWFKGDLTGYARERIRTGPLQEMNMFNMNAINEIIGEHEQGVSENGTKIWRLLVLAEWLQQFFGGKS